MKVLVRLVEKQSDGSDYCLLKGNRIEWANNTVVVYNNIYDTVGIFKAEDVRMVYMTEGKNERIDAVCKEHKNTL